MSILVYLTGNRCLIYGLTSKFIPKHLENRHSVFVPVPYCLDDCGFVVEPEVRQVDSSSSILLSQDCFGYSRFFAFPHKL